MRFYIQPRYNIKVIKIFFQDKGKKAELMAIVPYKGHFMSDEFRFKKHMAKCICHFLELAKNQSRKSLVEKDSVLSVTSPFLPGD